MQIVLGTFTQIATRFPIATLIGLAAISVGMGFAARTLHVANDPQEFLPNHPLAHASKQIEAQFGASSFAQTIYVRFVPKPGHTVASAQAVLEMEAVLQTLRSIGEIQSASGIPDYVKALRRELHGGQARYASLPPLQSTDDFGYTLDDLVRLALQRLALAQRFVSASGTAIATASVRKGADLIAVAREAPEKLEPLRQSAEAVDFDLYSYGATLDLFNRTTQTDARLFLPLAAALALLTLAWVFRYTDQRSLMIIGALWLGITGLSLVTEPVLFISLAAATLVLILGSFRRLSNLYLPLSVVLLAGLWTFGLLGLVGRPLNFLMLAVLPLLLGVGTDYAVHWLYRYEEERHRGRDGPAAIAVTSRRVGRALWLTTITTVAGFSSLIGIDSPPVQAFGMLANFAMATSFFITLWLVPAVKQLLREPARTDQRFSPNRVGNTLARYARWMNRRLVAAAVLVIFMASGVAFVWAGDSLKTIAYDPRRLLPADEPLVQLYERVNEEFHTYDEVQLLIEGDVTKLEAMRSLLLEIPARLSASPYTQNTLSIAQYVDDLRNTNSLVEQEFQSRMTGADPASAYQWVFDYIFSRPELRAEAESLLYAENEGRYSALLMRVNALRTPDQASIRRVAQEISARLSDVHDRLAQAGLVLTVTGTPFLQTLSLAILQDSLYRSLGLSLLLCLTIMTLVLHSIRWSLVSLFPVALSAWLVVGTIRALGIELSVATAMVTAICIGLGVDYAIHWMQRYREAGDLPQATARTGEALCGTFFTTLAAFTALIFGQIVWNRDFGILAAIAMSYAFALTLLVFPALARLVRPWLPAPKEG